MKTKEIVAILGAVTAAVAVVPPVVGMFKDSTGPTPPTIYVTGPGAAINTGSGTIHQRTYVDNSFKTYISKYVSHWHAGIAAITGHTPTSETTEETRVIQHSPAPSRGSEGTPAPSLRDDGLGQQQVDTDLHRSTPPQSAIQLPTRAQTTVANADAMLVDCDRTTKSDEYDAGQRQSFADALLSESSAPPQNKTESRFSSAPSADLTYALIQRQRGFSLEGDSVIAWHANTDKYSIKAYTRVALLGTLTENSSTGTVSGVGLEPLEFHEKHLRKVPTKIIFARGSEPLALVKGQESYSPKGSEQDGASATWQLVGTARAAGERFKPGTVWPMLVVEKREARLWTFRVVRREPVQTGIGKFDTFLVERELSSDGKNFRSDIWLAPGLEWYPVKMRSCDTDKNFQVQTLTELRQINLR